MSLQVKTKRLTWGGWGRGVAKGGTGGTNVSNKKVTTSTSLCLLSLHKASFFNLFLLFCYVDDTWMTTYEHICHNAWPTTVTLVIIAVGIKIPDARLAAVRLV